MHSAQEKADAIKRKAHELGFLACGIARAGFLETEAPRLERWLREGRRGISGHGGPPGVVVLERTGSTKESHASVAVTEGAGGMASQGAVASAGTPASTGAMRSWTVIICEAVLELPQSSVAVQVRVSV